MELCPQPALLLAITLPKRHFCLQSVTRSTLLAWLEDKCCDDYWLAGGYVEHVIAPGETAQLAVFDASAAEASPGAGGLMIDLREPPRVIDDSRANVSRAVMEGAARLLNEKIEQLKQRDIKFERAVMVGGPSRSPVWPGIVASITGLDLATGTAHAGARGAAILAGVGVGIHM